MAQYESDDALLAAMRTREERWPRLPQPQNMRPTLIEASLFELESESPAEPIVDSTDQPATRQDAVVDPPVDDVVPAPIHAHDVTSVNAATPPNPTQPAPSEQSAESIVNQAPQCAEAKPAVAHAVVVDRVMPDIASAETGLAMPIATPRERASQGEHAAPSHRLEQEMLLADGPPAAAFAGCPHCHRPMPTGAIVCLGCGFNILTGAVQDEDVARPVVRRRTSPGSWLGPIIIGCLLTMAAAIGARVVHGSDTGLLIFACAALASVLAWFAWTLFDARNVEGAHLRIWIVPLYVFAYVYRDSRSKYLRAATVGVVALLIACAVLGLDWNQRERDRSRGQHRLAETRASN